MKLFLLGCSLAAVTMFGQATTLELESFEKVWQTVADKHWNPKQLEQLPGGGNWQAIHASFRKRVVAAKSSDEVRGILREMIGLIGKSHYAISGFEAESGQTTRHGGGISPGFQVEAVGGKVLVTSVPASIPSVERGWELLKADGVAVKPVGSEMLHPELRVHQLLQQQIGGSPGQTIAYEFHDGKQTRVVEAKLPGSDGSAGFGFMQGMQVEREFRKVREVGYFRLNLFLDAVRVLPQFEQAIRDCTACRGFVIDLRGNPGGIAVMANAMAGWFVAKSGVKLGTMYQRGVDLNFIIIPRLNGFAGPLAILVDGASASTSEILAGGLQDLKRARIFGTRTAGAALPSVIEMLPNGDFFQYAIANYVSASGLELEGRGVIPDVTVAHTAEALRQGKDLALDAAIDWIYANPVAQDRTATARPAQR